MTNTNEELDPAAAMAWLDQQAADADTTQAEEVEQSEEVRSSEDSKTEETAGEANQDTGADDAATEAEDSVSKFIPDEIRSDFEAAATDEEKQAVLKKAFLLNADYTRKTQDLAKQREALKDLEQKAQWWDQLAQDPDALKRISPTEPEDDFDVLSAEPGELKAEIRKEAQGLLDEDRAERERAENAVLEYKAEIASALGSWAELNEVDEVVANAVTLALGNRLKVLGVDPMSHLTPDNLAPVLDDELARLKLEASISASKEAAEKSKSDITRAAKASSPPSQRAASIKDQDPWVAEERAPRPGEIQKKTMKELEDSGVDLNQLQ